MKCNSTSNLTYNDKDGLKRMPQNSHTDSSRLMEQIYSHNLACRETSKESPVDGISKGWCKKDVTPLLTDWSYIFFLLTHWYALFHMAQCDMFTIVLSSYNTTNSECQSDLGVTCVLYHGLMGDLSSLVSIVNVSPRKITTEYPGVLCIWQCVGHITRTFHTSNLRWVYPITQNIVVDCGMPCL